MPLTAYIDNEEIISIDQDETQWNDLKKRLKSKESVLTLKCCKKEGFLRTSCKGLRHFVHPKSQNTCDWKPESLEHLRAKVDIIEACKENGWEGIPEYSETNWRADVLAVRNEKRIAFEVQWSKQTFEETKFRQDRYKEANVRGCWFFRTAPKELTDYNDSILANKEIPAFKIFKDENSNIIAQLDQMQLPLKSLVASLLKGQLKFCEHIKPKPNQEVTIIFFDTSCWKCRRLQHLWTVELNLMTACNKNYVMFHDYDIDKSPQIYDAIKRFLQTERGKHLKIGQPKKRYSKRDRKSYLSHGCFYCDEVFSDFFIDLDKKRARQKCPNSIRHKVEIEFGTMKENEQHWCYSENGQFCE